jgi:hypothetical protein
MERSEIFQSLVNNHGVKKMLKWLFKPVDQWNEGYDWCVDSLMRNNDPQSIAEWLHDCIKAGRNGSYEKGVRAALFDYMMRGNKL